ncbi:MBL fold metallo-hydrolase [Roseomonas sp. BN140053]|uniref:MBL fold metallo-hydrolase n=1 Tax=Roseomonas sp. BN140053 TaxID=3391898 RepID=UPI0039E94109
MRPALHATLVNGRFGDPAVLVDSLHERRALLFDLGSLHALPARQLLRVEAALISHAHLDHLIGFDTLLRHLIGRERRVTLVGPAEIAVRIGHKLQGYGWDLAGSYAAELCFEVVELAPDLSSRRVRFRLATGFAAEPLGAAPPPADGVVLRLPGLEVRAAPLQHHRAACLGYLLAEVAHVNVWRPVLEARGLPVGPWLNGLKQAVLAERGDDHPIPVFARAGDAPEVLPLGGLREAVSLTPGQRIGYCTDLADTPGNRAAVQALVRGADLLFLESAFAAADAELAAARGHLTTRAAGEMARAAGVRRVEAFHFSPRYDGEEARLLAEVAEAFAA